MIRNKGNGFRVGQHLFGARNALSDQEGMGRRTCEAFETDKQVAGREGGLFGKNVKRIRAFRMCAHFRYDSFQAGFGVLTRRNRRSVHYRKQQRQRR